MTADWNLPDGPAIWVNPNAGNQRWNNIVRNVLADAGVQRHMVDVTAVALWSTWPDGTMDVHVVLELCMARVPTEIRAALPRLYSRQLFAAGCVPAHQYVLNTTPHGGIVTVHQTNIHTGGGNQFVAGRDQHIAIGGEGPWPQAAAQLNDLLENLRNVPDDPSTVAAVTAEVEGAYAAVLAGDAPTVRARLHAALRDSNPMMTFFGGLASIVGAVFAVIGG